MTENEFLKKLFAVRDSQPSEDAKARFDNSYFQTIKNPVVQFGYNRFLGFLAVSRFTLGLTKSAVAKLSLFLIFLIGSSIVEDPEQADSILELSVFFVSAVCSLGLWIWIIVDYFLLPGKTRQYNFRELDKWSS